MYLFIGTNWQKDLPLAVAQVDWRNETALSFWYIIIHHDQGRRWKFVAGGVQG